MDFFRDITGAAANPNLDLWEPVVIPKEAIDAEIARLSALPAPANGRRQSLIVHPRATAPGWGLAPGIRVTLSVLNPGETTVPYRHNATEVNFCIRGSGTARVGERHIPFDLHDVWNTPSYVPTSQTNDGTEIQARLTYTNAALLDMLNIHLEQDDPPADAAEAKEAAGHSVADPKRVNPFGTFELGDGAWMMPYETLINPPTVTSPVLHWPWQEVKVHLDKLEALGSDYVGRRLYLLHNPMTGRTNGTTPSFFATMTIRPPKIVDRPHRHVSAAINYYFSGSGRSTVEGKVYPWKAGDLMLSAPGWAVHNHASHDEHVYELTVQDQPFNIAMESLLWQESLKLPPLVLGSQAGFSTNRERVAAE